MSENRDRKPSLATSFQFAASYALVHGAFLPDEKLANIVERLDKVVTEILGYLEKLGLKTIYDTTKQLYDESKKQEKTSGRYIALMIAYLYSAPFLLTIVEAVSQEYAEEKMERGSENVHKQ
jgi:hypothetical protein